MIGRSAARVANFLAGHPKKRPLDPFFAHRGPRVVCRGAAQDAASKRTRFVAKSPSHGVDSNSFLRGVDDPPNLFNNPQKRVWWSFSTAFVGPFRGTLNMLKEAVALGKRLFS